LDCGANVGYSTVYLLSENPQCHAIAIEPDRSNFEALVRNTAAFGKRVRPVHGAVWSCVTSLSIEEDGYRDSREWAKQVRPARPGDASTVQGMDIPSLMALNADLAISLLKVDVEGAETVIFGPSSDAWLDKVQVIAIELHDDSSFGLASEVFHQAIRRHQFSAFKSGDVTICRRQPTTP
jgi:FkbM family methyltransferase